MAIEIEAKFDGLEPLLASLERMEKSIQQGTRYQPIQDALRRSGGRYLGAMRMRFLNAARGDGTWPDLAVSTKWARLRRKVRGIQNRLKVAKTEGERVGLRKKLGAEERRLGRLLGKTAKPSRAQQIQALVSGRKFEILRDTHELFGSLTEGAPGNIEEFLPMGLRVGTAVHYSKHHQDPLVPGRPPKREILVPPDAPLQHQMTADIARSIRRVITDARLKPDG